MRRRNDPSVWIAAICALICFVDGSRAEKAATPERLLQEGAAFARSCHEPDWEWPEAKKLANFEPCRRTVTALVAAIRSSKKDAKILREASPLLAAANYHMGFAAVQLAQLYADRKNRAASVRYARVACRSLDTPFFDPPQVIAGNMMAVGTQADVILGQSGQSCRPKSPPK